MSRIATTVTPVMGTVELSYGSQSVELTVYTGAVKVTAKSTFLGANVTMEAVGPDQLTGTYRRQDGLLTEITDTRTPMQRVSYLRSA
jgi:hypothetical protein